MLRLLKTDVSPFVRKVMVTLYETGKIDEVELVSVLGNPLDPDERLTSVNPLGKIPALQRDDGPTLYDSRVICRYLDAEAGTTLYPEARIWEVLPLEATADGLLDAGVLTIYEKRFRPEDKHYGPWIEGQWAKAARALDVLDQRWISHLNGPLDAGQIAVGCALGWLDFRLPNREWRKGRDGLAAWYADFEQRPSMQATVPTE